MRKSLCTLIFVSSLCFLALFAIVFSTFVIPLAQHYSLPIAFCTREDEVYQMIETHYQEWIEYFQTSRTPVLVFSTQSGEKYTVNASRWFGRANAPPEFFIQVRDEIQEPFGYAGYVYNNRFLLDRRYTVEHVGGDIYCYRL